MGTMGILDPFALASAYILAYSAFSRAFFSL